MKRYSLLHPNIDAEKIPEEAYVPPYFVHLHLDQVVSRIIASSADGDLAQLFRAPSADVDTIEYRHCVMRDLRRETNGACFEAFVSRLRQMRISIMSAGKTWNEYRRRIQHFEAVLSYCNAVHCLNSDLAALAFQSEGLVNLCNYLRNYAASERFVSLRAATLDMRAALASVKYCLWITESNIEIRKYAGESDVDAELAMLFGDHQAKADETSSTPEALSLSRVEDGILDGVARLYSDVFDRLAAYEVANRDYVDEQIEQFGRDVQFYLSYIRYMGTFERAGLHFCYPVVSRESGIIHYRDGFDLALAQKLIDEKSTVVCNDICLQAGQRILIVTGPNQSGKTTFARMFGQIHHLACLGLPVPGKEVRLSLCDHIFTHFGEQECAADLKGHLWRDLIGIDDILKRATSHSVIILNEIFNGATRQDAIFLSGKIFEWISELGAICVWVTFVKELALAGPNAVSVIGTVQSQAPYMATYKIIPAVPGGRSYGLAIAERRRVTYVQLKERLRDKCKSHVKGR